MTSRKDSDMDFLGDIISFILINGLTAMSFYLLGVVSTTFFGKQMKKSIASWIVELESDKKSTNDKTE